MSEFVRTDNPSLLRLSVGAIDESAVKKPANSIQIVCKVSGKDSIKPKPGELSLKETNTGSLRKYEVSGNQTSFLLNRSQGHPRILLIVEFFIAVNVEEQIENALAKERLSMFDVINFADTEILVQRAASYSGIIYMSKGRLIQYDHFESMFNSGCIESQPQKAIKGRDPSGETLDLPADDDEIRVPVDIAARAEDHPLRYRIVVTDFSYQTVKGVMQWMQCGVIHFSTAPGQEKRNDELPTWQQSLPKYNPKSIFRLADKWMLTGLTSLAMVGYWNWLTLDRAVHDSINENVKLYDRLQCVLVDYLSAYEQYVKNDQDLRHACYQHAYTADILLGFQTRPLKRCQENNENSLYDRARSNALFISTNCSSRIPKRGL